MVGASSETRWRGPVCLTLGSLELNFVHNLTTRPLHFGNSSSVGLNWTHIHMVLRFRKWCGNLPTHPHDYEPLRNALWELCPPRDGKTLNIRSIGSKLHHLRLRVVGGYFFDKRDTDQGARWLIRTANPDSTGSNDSASLTRPRVQARVRARHQR